MGSRPTTEGRRYCANARKRQRPTDGCQVPPGWHTCPQELALSRTRIRRAQRQRSWMAMREASRMLLRLHDLAEVLRRCEPSSSDLAGGPIGQHGLQPLVNTCQMRSLQGGGDRDVLADTAAERGPTTPAPTNTATTGAIPPTMVGGLSATEGSPRDGAVIAAPVTAAENRHREVHGRGRRGRTNSPMTPSSLEDAPGGGMQDGSCLEQRPRSSSGEDDRAAAAAEAPRKPITTATPAVATPDMDTVMTVRKTMKTMTAPCLAGDETSPCGPAPAWKDPAIRPADVSAPRPPTAMSDDGAPTSEPILHVSTTPSALPLEKSPDGEAGGDCSKHNPSRTHDVSVPRLDDGRECRDGQSNPMTIATLWTCRVDAR